MNQVELATHFTGLMGSLGVPILASSIQTGEEGVESIVSLFTTREGLGKLAERYHAQIQEGALQLDKYFQSSAPVTPPSRDYMRFIADMSRQPLLRHESGCFIEPPIQIPEGYVIYPYSPSKYEDRL